MKKNPEFENWIADQMATGMIIMEPYGYREEEGKYLHITNLGRTVTELMKERFTDIADLKKSNIISYIRVTSRIFRERS